MPKKFGNLQACVGRHIHELCTIVGAVREVWAAAGGLAAAVTFQFPVLHAKDLLVPAGLRWPRHS